MGYIYLIRNTVNGKGYIGKTGRTVELRFAGHVVEALSGGLRPICRAIREHGAENFSVTEILFFESEHLNALEKGFIGIYGTYTDGYNATPGGEGGGVKQLGCPLRLRLSARLQSLCRERGLTQRQLAIQAELDPGFVSRIIRGLKEPGLVTMDALAAVFGLTLSEFFEGLG